MPALFFHHATAGWLALLGLVVPLAIYLWNRRPGRVVQVGSVRWLEAAANRRLRSIKPEQLLLLLLRAAILSLLALVVAEPVQQLALPPRHGQALLSEAATPAQLAAVRPVLDSLRRQGYQLRRLGQAVSAPQSWATVGLGEPGEAADTTQTSSLPLTACATSFNLWSAVRQAADSLPNRPFVVLAPLTLDAFSGTRPALPAQVRWVPLPTPDSAAWPVAAWRPQPDSLVLLLAHGSENGVSFRRVRRSWPAASGPIAGLGTDVEAAFDAARGEFTTPTSSNSRQPLPLLTKPIRLAVSYDAAHAPSARVLGAALRAAGSVLPLSPRLTLSSAVPSPADSLDWLFWLREAPVPAEWAGQVAAGLHIWQEAPNRSPALAGSFGITGNAAPVQLQRLDTSKQKSAVVAWPLATGGPLLSTRTRGTGAWYRLHTRLDPTWSSLADSPELPALLLPLLLPASPPIPTPDPRAMPISQLQGRPEVAPVTGGPATSAPIRNLAPWAAAAAGVLFALERLLAARRLGQKAA
ncbi:hypothetical protein DNI29_14520 [Hymenobacter sediminis]|uniref:BatA domain-containing protein n=1 Tax=Hymenobacter sediminis TaxID=2218621 RepID=UPI000DA65BEB|nr:BatA domain-containing protein [Hymenobacter sediminis]RPD46216.1 hypothetical protein DNI29_14520 [Hymenobacter sediminis]